VVGERRHSRYIVVGMGISAKTLHKTEVEIIDISVGGCSIRGTKRFSLGGEYVFRFELERGVVSVKGSIVWEKMSGIRRISEAEAMPVYTAGIEFKDVFKDSALEIKDFIADKLKKRRLGGIRMKLRSPGKTIISYPEDCEVSDLSLGGMRMVTEQELLTETVFSIELLLPDNENQITCKGRVAYCHATPAETQTRFSVGMEFIDMDAQAMSMLRKFIESLPSATRLS
jgi:c-di-GMP-binding flagellar brake protein YcgR